MKRSFLRTMLTIVLLSFLAGGASAHGTHHGSPDAQKAARPLEPSPSLRFQFRDAIWTRDIDAALKMLREHPKLAVIRLGFYSLETALPLAVHVNSLELVEALLKAGADANQMMAPGLSIFSPCLRHACANGNVKIVEALLKAGARVKNDDDDSIAPMHLASKGGHVEVMKRLIAAGAAVDVKTKNQETPLHYAALSDNSAAVELLLDHGAKLDTETKRGVRPIHVAVARGHIQTYALLIQRGADVTPDPYKQTLLHYAVGGCALEYGRAEPRREMVLRIIGDGLSLDARDSSGKTPLFGATSSEIIDLLLQFRADPNATDSDGLKPIHLISNRASPAALRRLLREKVDVNAKDNTGRTPLHYYVHNPEIARVLIEAGADVNARTKNNETPLQMWTGGFQPRVALVLLEAGASSADTADLSGRTPLHRYSEMRPGSYGVDAKYREKLLIALIQRKASVNQKDNRGRTALHILAEMTLYNEHALSKKLLDVLVEHGADVKLVDSKGRTALDLLKKNPQTELADYLSKISSD